MRYVELFAGAGGLSMGLEAAGMHPVAHAEIEPHARAVLRHHWPDTPLHGDVTQVDWTQYAGQVDLVAGGSPCQDLSVAGKRAGLAGARSGLFFELIRAWEETGAPYCLWENVDGARSSNKGEDFAAVLSAFVGAPVAVPGTGRWTSAGVVAGSTGVAAWRVLDLQHFGPPQRRRRIFVVAARAGGADPAEILALSQGVCGHPSPREQSRQGSARGAAGGAGGSISWDNELNARVEAHGPLMARGKSGGDRNGVLAFTTTQTPKVGGDVALTLEAASRSGGGQTPAVLAFQNTGQGWWNQSDVAQTIRTPTSGDSRLANVLAFESTGGDVALTLGANTQGDQAPHIVCLASGQANAEVMRDVVGTLDFGGHGGSYNGQDAYQGRILPAAGRPRRLTPLECERLMGWPESGFLIRFEACLDHLRSLAHAAALSLKSLSVVGRAEVTVSSGSARCAEHHFLPSAQTQAPAVAARVVISICSRQVFVGLSNGELSFSAKSVAESKRCGHLVALARTALSNASSLDTKASAVQIGAVVFQTNATNSTRAERGSELLESCGNETGNASGAESFQSEADRQSENCITSGVGRSSKSFDSTWETLCCSVVDAISGSIRGAMSEGSSFVCELIISDGHTAQGICEDGTAYALSDTARYRLCGNGVGTPVAAWIGRRLAEAHSL